MTSKDIIRYRKRYSNYDFKDKKRDEDIILIVRRHWLVFIFKFMPIILGVVALVFFHFFILEYGHYMFYEINKSLVYFIESIVALFLWLLLFVFWVDFYFDVWIITNSRIVDIEQRGLFSRNISELEHSKIQDVTTEIHGVLPTFLRYGFVYVQTAGRKGRFVFKEVPHPNFIRKLVIELQKRALKNNRVKSAP